MEDENWLDNIFKKLNETDEELTAASYIEQWMDGEICDEICEDARSGCPESRKFIDDICLMMDSATFHMTQPSADHNRIERELNQVIELIDSVS
jgi:hypothetical protein